MVSGKSVADLEILPNNLINLKYIRFASASIDDIMPFIRRSVDLKRISIYEFEAGVHFNTDTHVIDLLALNREREKLPDADKITLYVDERIYLETRWAIKETDLKFIRLRREAYFSDSIREG